MHDPVRDEGARAKQCNSRCQERAFVLKRVGVKGRRWRFRSPIAFHYVAARVATDIPSILAATIDDTVSV